MNEHFEGYKNYGTFRNRYNVDVLTEKYNEKCRKRRGVSCEMITFKLKKSAESLVDRVSDDNLYKLMRTQV